MEKVSAVIITKNNENIITNCLNSLHWADEIVIVDSGSTDKTLAICETFNCKIIKSPWLGFGKTKQLAVKNASHNWIFSIDSDEVCSEEFNKDIRKTLSSPQHDGYHIKRRTFYLNKPIRFCGWQNDYPLRLFRKDKGDFNDRSIHEYVELKGSKGKIMALLYHHSFPTISSHLQKMNHYTDLGALEAYGKGKKSSPLSAVFNRGEGKSIHLFKQREISTALLLSGI